MLSFRQFWFIPFAAAARDAAPDSVGTALWPAAGESRDENHPVNPRLFQASRCAAMFLYCVNLSSGVAAAILALAADGVSRSSRR